MSETLNVTLVTFLGYVDQSRLYKWCYVYRLKDMFFHTPYILPFVKQICP